MSKARRKPAREVRGRRSSEPRPADFWREPGAPGPAGPVTPPADPTALVRSLGPPPLPGQGSAADHYLAAVVERASALATALAAAAGILAAGDDEEAPGP